LDECIWFDMNSAIFYQDFQLTSSQGRSWTWQLKSYPRKRNWHTLASLRLLSFCL
jgi:hypothetical protein